MYQDHVIVRSHNYDIIVISLEIFIIAHSEGIGISFCPKVRLPHTFSQAYTILVSRYTLFFGTKYLDLQLHITDYKNKRLFIDNHGQKGWYHWWYLFFFLIIMLNDILRPRSNGEHNPCCFYINFKIANFVIVAFFRCRSNDLKSILITDFAWPIVPSILFVLKAT